MRARYGRRAPRASAGLRQRRRGAGGRSAPARRRTRASRAPRSYQWNLVVALDVDRKLLDGAECGLHRRREGRETALAERLLEPPGGRAERVEVRAGRDARLRLQRLGERGGGGLRLVDALGVVRLAQIGEPGAELREMGAAPRLRPPQTPPPPRRAPRATRPPAPDDRRSAAAHRRPARARNAPRRTRTRRGR